MANGNAATGEPDQALLDRIPQWARLVLHVGCGTGELGVAFKQLNPHARVIGIEPDAEAAARAAACLDHVYAAPLDALLGPEIARHSIDCIVYNHSLARVEHPWALLERHCEYLQQDGVVLIALANVEYWQAAEHLLRGTLGFVQDAVASQLSRNAVEQALQRAGLQIAETHSVVVDLEAAQQFTDVLEPALQRLGISQTAYMKRAAPHTLIWRAQRRPKPRLQLVSTMLNPIGGVSHVRVVEPLRAIASDPGFTTAIVSNTGPIPAPEGEQRIFVFHRPAMIGDEWLGRLRYMLNQGWLLVCEFDDHPDHIPILQQPDVQNFRAVHAVQTTTQPLAEVLRQKNPEVAVFPNAVAALPDVVNYADPEQLTLFFAALNRKDDWPPYIDVFNAIAAKVGPRLRFQIVGERQLFEALDTPHKSFTPVCDYETYHALLGRSELSFMPLGDTPFNQCKSDLKFLEAASHRVTALASNVVYPDTIDDRRTGLIFVNPAELEHNLLRVLDDPLFGRRIADNARRYITEQRMLAGQLQARLAWYRDLWSRREQLHRALLERVPELA